MISAEQQEQASLYVLGALTAPERNAFEAEVRGQPELQELVRSLERTAGLLAMAVPSILPPRQLRDRILQQIQADDRPSRSMPASALNLTGLTPGFLFVGATDPAGWKQLPVPGASIKLLTVDRDRGYAVLLGKLEPKTCYPAHTHEGSEDLFLLSGDLRVGGRVMGPGDFHHSDAGTSHPQNYSEAGCTLLAILSVDHALAKFALA